MADLMPPSELVLSLDKPIEFNNTTYDSITLREPTLDEMDAAGNEKTPTRMIKLLISKVSGVPLQAVGMLPISKVVEAGAYFEGFTPPSPETGGT